MLKDCRATLATMILIMLIATSAMAQRKPRPELTGEDIIRKGLLRAQGTISPGWTIADGNTNIYLQGDMEYFLQDKVTLKGDISYFIGSVGSKLLKHNHSLFFGAQYHMPYKRFDPYIGLHPGISVVQMRNPNLGTPEIDIAVAESNMKVAPAISVSTGFNFYVWRYIHFMANLKYVHTRHATEWGASYALDEFRISFGLGWNVNILKRK
jgi:hypothetical protein